ncbi:ADP-ribosylglycohydrolase family protein, partial [Streptomyces sp. NPDC005568]|uniref:ADP-ribosylglycohydrolase family protein n=1 Tax=Streptomyces sp. NPDC005568 TaxID=3156887 RepID=UPI0033AD6B8B
MVVGEGQILGQIKDSLATAQELHTAGRLLNDPDQGPRGPGEHAQGRHDPPGPEALLDGVIALVPRSAVGAGLRRARDMLDYGDTATVAAVLGCGRRTTAHDTVPFALWSAARALGGYEEAFWATAQVGGDMDTTCAIVGGVVASAETGAPPSTWLERTEPLPEWVAVPA